MFLALISEIKQPVFVAEEWLAEHKPNKKLTGDFWNEINNEYDKVVKEFKDFLVSEDQVLNSMKNLLRPIDIYNAIEDYKIRIEKLMLIYNIRLYKTYNVNKKTGVRYIVMRAFWYDSKGKSVRWFSKNIGAENKVAINGQIPKHMLDSVEDEILHLMWDQYTHEYYGNVTFGK